MMPMFDDRRIDAFDPVAGREYFVGVLGRRIMAFVLDFIIVWAPIVVASVLIFVFGFITLGLGWFLFGLLGPAYFVWAIIYSALTLGGPRTSTLGMRMMSIEMRLVDGGVMNPVMAVMSLVLFWLSVSFLTPFIVIVGLLNERRRLLHDFVIGTVVVNNEERAAFLRGDPRGHVGVRG